MALLRSVEEDLDGTRIPGMGPGHGRRGERETAQGVIEPRRDRDVARARLQIRLRPAGTQGHAPAIGRVRALTVAILPRSWRRAWPRRGSRTSASI